MTHFLTAIIVPKKIYNQGEEATAKFIEGLMWPYCEEYEVTPYIEKTKAEIEQEFADWKKELQEKLSKGEKIEEYYNKYIVDGNIKPITIKEWVKDWSGKDMDIYGNVITTWNQDSFWDWYRIGGRWDGIITENPQSSENGFNFCSKHETVENNSIHIEILLNRLKDKIKENEKGKETIREVISSIKSPFGGFGFADIIREFTGREKMADLEPKEKELYEKIEKRFIETLEKFEVWNPFIIHKILDSEGKLYDGRRYGWFGISEDKQEPEEWLNIYTKLLEDNKEDYLVTLDCHV
jgi:hypothetical protein